MHRSTISREKSPRHRTAVTAALFAGLLATAALAASASPAAAATAPQLEKAGWTCITPLPFADDQHCFRPKGFERLITGEARAVKAQVFDATGQVYEGTELNVRGDVFNGQPCPTDPPTFEYTYLGPIFGLDYWACHRFDSDHT
jgi:hypothetical protein